MASGESHSENLLILGAGGYGRLVKEIAEQDGRNFRKICFLDDKAVSGDVIGKLEELEKFKEEFHYAIVAMGNSETRRQWVERLLKIGYELPSLVHAKAYVAPSAKIAGGCVVEPMTVVNANAEIGCASFICAGAVVNHNAKVGAFCQIDCNAVVKAGSAVHDDTKVLSCNMND